MYKICQIKQLKEWIKKVILLNTDRTDKTHYVKFDFFQCELLKKIKVKPMKS